MEGVGVGIFLAVLVTVGDANVGAGVAVFWEQTFSAGDGNEGGSGGGGDANSNVTESGLPDAGSMVVVAEEIEVDFASVLSPGISVSLSSNEMIG